MQRPRPAAAARPSPPWQSPRARGAGRASELYNAPPRGSGAGGPPMPCARRPGAPDSLLATPSTSHDRAFRARRQHSQHKNYCARRRRNRPKKNRVRTRCRYCEDKKAGKHWTLRNKKGCARIEGSCVTKNIAPKGKRAPPPSRHHTPSLHAVRRARAQLAAARAAPLPHTIARAPQAARARARGRGRGPLCVCPPRPRTVAPTRARDRRTTAVCPRGRATAACSCTRARHGRVPARAARASHRRVRV